MRVLQVDSGREWRGGQNQVRLLCRELVREPSVDLVLLTRRTGELARRAAELGVPLRGVRWLFAHDPFVWWALVRELRAAPRDIVHAHDSHALQLAAWARRYAGAATRLVATRRVDFHLRPHSAWHQVDAVIAISDAVRRILIADGIPASRIALVPSGIDPDEVRAAARRPFGVRARLGLAADAPVAVNVAALVDHKDQRTLVRAAAHARAARPDLHWIIAGEGARRGDLGAEIGRLGLRDRVHLVGYVAEAAALIAEANVFVMSSKEEGLGSVILDALALGRSVVATAGGGIPEILPAAALVPVGDAAALARKVVQAIDHPSPVPLPPRFTAREMAQGVLAVYRSLF